MIATKNKNANGKKAQPQATADKRAERLGAKLIECIDEYAPYLLYSRNMTCPISGEVFIGGHDVVEHLCSEHGYTPEQAIDAICVRQMTEQFKSTLEADDLIEAKHLP